MQYNTFLVHKFETSAQNASIFYNMILVAQTKATAGS